MALGGLLRRDGFGSHACWPVAGCRRRDRQSLHFGTLLTSALNRGRPWYWFWATVLVYATWGGLILAWTR
jgi:hypothetical protein